MHKLNSLRHCHFSQGTTGRGFTIVELLIVIVVIAILAAMSAVAYVGIQQRTQETAIKSDFSNFAKLVEIYRVNNGQYPPPIITNLDTLNFRASKAAYPKSFAYNIDYCTNGAGKHSEYVLFAYISEDRLTGVYVSSKNSSPKVLTFDEYYGSSPCYNTHPNSVAVDAGLTGIVSGINGVRPAGWSPWVE